MPPTVPINHYFGPRNQQNKTKVLFHYSMLMYSSETACFEHSNFFKVNVSNTRIPATQLRAQVVFEKLRFEPRLQYRPITEFYPGWVSDRNALKKGPRNSTTSFLTATTLIYAIGAGITAAAGTRLALQLVLVKRFKLYSFQLQSRKGPALLFIVTTSLCQDWVICAPAAFLGCGSHFSGSLSGIEP